MLYLHIADGKSLNLQIRNDPATAALLSTMPDECHGIILSAASRILTKYNPEKREALIKRLLDESFSTLDVAPEADTAIRGAIERSGIEAKKWEIL